MFGSSMKEQRTYGSVKIAFEAAKAFANHQGYTLVPMDELDYDKDLKFNGVQFHPSWASIFALIGLRTALPDAKYFIFIDPGTLITYPESHVFNHYINIMESDPDWKILALETVEPHLLGTSLLIFKNEDFCFDVFFDSIDLAKHSKSNLAQLYPCEKGAIAEHMRTIDPTGQHLVKLPAHRPPYSLSPIYWLFSGAPAGPLDRYEYGDAMVRFPGIAENHKLLVMNGILAEATRWRSQRPSFCKYPLSFEAEEGKNEDYTLLKNRDLIIFKC